MLSQARAELFALFEDVTTHAGRKVILRHRGGGRDAVLVSREYLERIERAQASAEGGSFSLFGSATLNRPLEEALGEIRQDAAAASERKLLAMTGAEAPRSAEGGSGPRRDPRRPAAAGKAKRR